MTEIEEAIRREFKRQQREAGLLLVQDGDGPKPSIHLYGALDVAAFVTAIEKVVEARS